jgi:RNA polymerase sigma factor (sigma-70 family)
MGAPKTAPRRRPLPESDLPLDSTAVLIGRAKAGDAGAVEALAARYLPLLQRWAHGRLPSGARGLVETGDLVQLTLVRALGHLDTFEPRGEGAFLAYLRRSLMNLLRNEIRRSVNHPTHPMPEDIRDERMSLLEQVIGKEVIDAYEAGLATLPEAMQEAIILRLEFGFGYREIAAAIGSPSTNAARMLVSRAMVKLSKTMDEHRS